MSALRYTAIRGMFEALWLSQLPRLVRRLSKCRGVIFTLHRVLPEEPADFSPNAILQVRPDFLDYTIRRVRELGLDIVDLGEGLRRIESDTPERPFVVFTFDDAYRDNLRHALPILRRNQCPFTLYVPTALVDGVGQIWWQAIEDIIAGQDAIAVTYAGETDYISCATLAEKQEAYDQLYWRLRALPEADRVELVEALAAQYGFDLDAQCRQLIMDWSELKTFAGEQLCTLGAHTVHHYELAKLSAADARNEMEQSIRVMKAQFGTAPIHLSYPIGGPAACGPREFEIAKDLGLRSAVTTRPGGLYPRHRLAPHSLPRVSLNGLFQVRRYVDVFATGALFSMLPAS
jgi:peptidoglycan/xylan/chitin deacetylase (PgdA/CDA1 family)